MTSKQRALNKLGAELRKKVRANENKPVVKFFNEVSPLVDINTLLNIHDRLTSAAKELMVKKNNDYTDGSVDPFANFRISTTLNVEPVIGILLRMQDKMQRIKTFINKGTLQVNDESVQDSLRDLINYTVLIGGLIEEKNLLGETK